MLQTGDAVRDTTAQSAVRLSLSVRRSLAGAALLVLAVVAVRWGLFVAQAALNAQGRFDFATYYAAAAALRGNLHANIYDVGVLARSSATGTVLPYTYPPLFALLLSPFTLLSFKTLARLWLVGNAAVWLGVALLLARELRLLLGSRLAAQPRAASPSVVVRLRSWLSDDPAPLVALAVSATLCLTFAPAAQTLLTGQINFLMLLPLALIPWLTRTGHERWVGVCVALAAMLKLTPAVLIAYLLLRRRWEAALAALATLLGLTLISLVAVGPGTLFAFIPQALQVGAGDAGLGHNQALFAPLALAAGSAGKVVTLLGWLVLAAFALWLGRRLWRAPRLTVPTGATSAVENACYAIALCAMLLLSPTAWVHHYVWLLPAAALALGLAGRDLMGAWGTAEARTAALRLALVVAAAVALGLTLPDAWDTEPQPAVTHFAGLPLWPLALEARPLGALVLSLALAGWWARPRARAARTTGE
jgi:alpha-1,2-mannosyltransferase